MAQHDMKTAKKFDSQPRHQRRQEKVQGFIRFLPLLAVPLKRRQTAGHTSLMKKNVRLDFQKTPNLRFFNLMHS